MSILIKGMEMPTSCYDCNCFIRDSDGSDYCCLLMQDIVDNNKRDDDCPLVPVPLHGRLIDADAILEHRFVGVVGEKEKSSYMVGWNNALEAVVENAETILGGE